MTKAKMGKGIIPIIMFILLFQYSFSQELNIGGEVGFWPINNISAGVAGALIEYKLEKPIVSFNTGLISFISKESTIVTLPLYFKLLFGYKLRFCPTIGGFIRTSGSYGFSAGLHIEYKIRNKIRIFAKGEYNKDLYQARYISHFGNSGTYTEGNSSIWVSFGVKVNVLRKNKQQTNANNKENRIFHLSSILKLF